MTEANGVAVTSGGYSPIDWRRAASTGGLLARGGPQISRAAADEAVRELREVTPKAEQHVRELTGLGADLPLYPGEIVDRPGWVRAAAGGLSTLTDGALTGVGSVVGKRVGGVLAGSAGVQAGMVLAFLATRVLGQYDPFTPGEGGAEDPLAGSSISTVGQLLIVAPNVVAAEQAMDVSTEDFRLWVCLHECTHRLQFTAVPWLREYFGGQVRALLSSMESTAAATAARLPDALAELRKRLRSGEGIGGPVGLIELLQDDEQRAILHRLLALSTLLEGHADHVMDAVGPAVVPTVSTIRERFSQRRKGGGPFDRLLRTLLGVEAKVRQYAEGSAFTTHVVDAVGMSGFNVVWTSPETLPTRAEIADPDQWLRRVHG